MLWGQMWGCRAEPQGAEGLAGSGQVPLRVGTEDPAPPSPGLPTPGGGGGLPASLAAPAPGPGPQQVQGENAGTRGGMTGGRQLRAPSLKDTEPEPWVLLPGLHPVSPSQSLSPPRLP